MISRGVAAGASSPKPPETTYPGRPDSIIVGISGAPTERFSPARAIALSFPDLIWGMTVAALVRSICT